MYFQLCISWNLCKIPHHLITFFASSVCVLSLFFEPFKTCYVYQTNSLNVVFTGGYKQRVKYTKFFFFFELITAVMLERRMESNYLKMGVKMGILNHNKREHAATSCSYLLLTWKR